MDWSSSASPLVTTAHTTYTTDMRGRDIDLVKALDPAKVTVTNPLTDSVRWNSANRKWEIFNGTTWVALIDYYAIEVGAFTGDVTKAAGASALTIAAAAVTYAKMQNVSATDRVLGRSSAGAGVIEEIVVTVAGRALIDDADAVAQRTTLGLGTLATQSGTFSGTSSGTNTGDQTSVSGNAGTATALQTARTINGVSFDGTANVELPILQNSQSAAYTLVAADANKHILHPSADTIARTFTIPANSSVAYAVGTAITFVNQNAAGVLTIAITTDTMRLAGPGTAGSRTLAANGIATALKITSTEWIISGTGLT